MSGAALSSPVFGFTPDAAGTYVFTVVATDSTGLSSAPFTVQVPTGICGPNLTGIVASPSSTAVGTAVLLSAMPPTLTSSCVAGGAIRRPGGSGSPVGSSATLLSLSGTASSFTPDVAGAYSRGFRHGRRRLLDRSGTGRRGADVHGAAVRAGILASTTTLRLRPRHAQAQGGAPGCGSGASARITHYLYSFVSEPGPARRLLPGRTSASTTGFVPDSAEPELAGIAGGPRRAG